MLSCPPPPSPPNLMQSPVCCCMVQWFTPPSAHPTTPPSQLQGSHTKNREQGTCGGWGTWCVDMREGLVAQGKREREEARGRGHGAEPREVKLRRQDGQWHDSVDKDGPMVCSRKGSLITHRLPQEKQCEGGEQRRASNSSTDPASSPSSSFSSLPLPVSLSLSLFGTALRRAVAVPSPPSILPARSPRRTSNPSATSTPGFL